MFQNINTILHKTICSTSANDSRHGGPRLNTFVQHWFRSAQLKHIRYYSVTDPIQRLIVRRQHDVSIDKPISVVRWRDGRHLFRWARQKELASVTASTLKHIIKNWTFEIDTKTDSNKMCHEYKIDGSGRNDTRWQVLFLQLQPVYSHPNSMTHTAYSWIQRVHPSVCLSHETTEIIQRTRT